MGFVCPRCGKPGTLGITHAIELPATLSPGSDELALQLLACAACGLHAVAVYEESRRGALDREIGRASCRERV